MRRRILVPGMAAMPGVMMVNTTVASTVQNQTSRAWGHGVTVALLIGLTLTACTQFTLGPQQTHGPLLPPFLHPPQVRYAPLHPLANEPIEFTIRVSRSEPHSPAPSTLELFLYEYEATTPEIAGDVVAVARRGPGVHWGLVHSWSRSDFQSLYRGVIPERLEVTFRLPGGFQDRTYVFLIARLTDALGRTTSDAWGFAAGEWPAKHLPVPLKHSGPLNCRISVGFAAADSKCPADASTIRCACAEETETLACSPRPLYSPCERIGDCNCRDGLSGYTSPRDVLSDQDFADLIFEGYPSNNGVALGERYWQYFYLANAMPNSYLKYAVHAWSLQMDHGPVDEASALLNAVGIVHRKNWCDTALDATPNLFTAEPKNKGTAIHESAHRIFSLSDEYPGANILLSSWPHHNVYLSESECNAYNANPNYGLGPCSSFLDRNNDTWWSSEKQPSTPQLPNVCDPALTTPDRFCIMFSDCDTKVPRFGPTCLRRIAWYYQTQIPQTCDTLPTTPGNIPQRIRLFGIIPTLFVKFKASQNGYALATSESIMGASSRPSDLGGDVLITARNGMGMIVSQSSMGNPRTRHGKFADMGPLDEAEFAVPLAHPDMIRSVEIEVRRGPNRSLKCSFPIPRQEDGACVIAK